MILCSTQKTFVFRLKDNNKNLSIPSDYASKKFVRMRIIINFATAVKFTAVKKMRYEIF